VGDFERARVDGPVLFERVGAFLVDIIDGYSFGYMFVVVNIVTKKKKE
jgi:hypothetical protein